MSRGAFTAHLVQVRLHELEHDIDVLEVSGAGWQAYVLDLDDICRDRESHHAAWVEGVWGEI